MYICVKKHKKRSCKNELLPEQSKKSVLGTMCVMATLHGVLKSHQIWTFENLSKNWVIKKSRCTYKKNLVGILRVVANVCSRWFLTSNNHTTQHWWCTLSIFRGIIPSLILFSSLCRTKKLGFFCLEATSRNHSHSKNLGLIKTFLKSHSSSTQVREWNNSCELWKQLDNINHFHILRPTVKSIDGGDP